MGKHRSNEQDKIFLKFMEEHRDIARGYVKKDKATQDDLWSKLTLELNSSGPPFKDAVAWKKTWLDWKGNIRRKLAHNKAESHSTGGGPYNQFVLTAIETDLATICGIFKVVDGIPSSKCFGHASAMNIENNSSADKEFEECVDALMTDVCEGGEKSAQTLTTPIGSQLPCNSTTKCKNTDVNQLLEEENQHMKTIANMLEKIHLVGETHSNHLKNIEKLMSDLHMLKKEEILENKRHHLQLEKHLATKIELKLQVIELEREKLDILNP